ncbi:hypothetical protein DRO31_01700 [Candidatus Bathyarchaeota archaeon]|nr:MAG: hypothetical protein DRO31_01700 [Candidatus Bathyarchaeota archaeon]
MQGLTRVKFSNLDKLLYPELQMSKADIIEYYIKAAPKMLHLLRDRTLVHTRYPDGIKGEGFYEKDLPGGSPRLGADVHKVQRIRRQRYRLCSMQRLGYTHLAS